MFVSSMELRNWRNFTKASVEFHEVTYIVGPNACGKSNLLDVFRFMRDIANPSGGGLQKALKERGGLDKVRSLAARKNATVEIEFSLHDDLRDRTAEPAWRYALHIQSEGKRRQRPIVAKETVARRGEVIVSRPEDEDRQDPERLTQTYLEQINMNRDFREVVTFFERVLYLHLVPQLLKFGDQMTARNIEADPFGQGFLEEVASTAVKTRESRLKKIEEMLRGLIPNLEKLRLVKDEATGRPHLEMLYKHWRRDAGWLREDQFSDGTLRLIATLWTLFSSNSIILLEEPELSLHQRVVEQIPAIIYKARQQRKKTGGQVFVSTHSEAMLSHKGIDATYLLLEPREGGEATRVSEPSEEDTAAMAAGLSPADVLLPKTGKSVKSIA